MIRSLVAAFAPQASEINKLCCHWISSQSWRLCRSLNIPYLVSKDWRLCRTLNCPDPVRVHGIK